MDLLEIRQSLETAKENSLRIQFKKESAISGIKEQISKLSNDKLEVLNRFGLNGDFLLDVDYDKLGSNEEYCNKIKEDVRKLIFEAKSILEKELC